MPSRLVALVTGSSRGVGKGIAIALEMKGARVHVTGRTAEADPAWFPGTVHETAAAVTAAGGEGVALRCDNSDDIAVREVFDRIESEAGRLDILVNNVPDLRAKLGGAGAFWEKPIELAVLVDVGLRSHYVASHHAARLLAPRRHGLIVGISFYGAVSYFHGPAYGAQKAGLDKMMADMARELRPHDVATLSIWPGTVATERVMASLNASRNGATSSTQRLKRPEFTGIVIDAVYRNSDRMRLSGQTVIAAELAREHGITDLDGRQPPSYRETLGAPPARFVPADPNKITGRRSQSATG